MTKLPNFQTLAYVCGSVCLASSLSIHRRECLAAATSTQPLAAFCSSPFRHCAPRREKERWRRRKGGGGGRDDKKKRVFVGLWDVGKRFSNSLCFVPLLLSFLPSFFHPSPSETGNFHVSPRCCWCRMIAILTVARTLHGSRPGS